MNELDRKLQDKNRLPGSEKFTKPSDVKGLQKFLRKVKRVQDEHTKLSEDILGVYGRTTGKIVTIDRLPGEETIDYLKDDRDIKLSNVVDKLLENSNSEIDHLSNDIIKLDDINDSKLSTDIVKLNDETEVGLSNVIDKLHIDDDNELSRYKERLHTDDHELELSKEIISIKDSQLVNQLSNYKESISDFEFLKELSNRVENLADNSPSLELSDKVEYITDETQVRLSTEIDKIKVEDETELSKNIISISKEEDNKLSDYVDKVNFKEDNKLSDYIEGLNKEEDNKLSDYIEGLNKEEDNKLSDYIEGLNFKEDNKLSDYIDKVNFKEDNKLSDYIDKVNFKEDNKLSDYIEGLSKEEDNKLSDYTEFAPNGFAKIDSLSDKKLDIDPDLNVELSNKKELLNEGDYKDVEELYNNQEAIKLGKRLSKYTPLSEDIISLNLDDKDTELSDEVINIYKEQEVSELSKQIEALKGNKPGYVDIEEYSELGSIERIPEDIREGIGSEIRTILNKVMAEDRELSSEAVFNKVIKLLNRFNTVVTSDGKRYVTEEDHNSWVSKVEALVTHYLSGEGKLSLEKASDYKEKLVNALSLRDIKYIKEIENRYKQFNPSESNFSLTLKNENNPKSLSDYKESIAVDKNNDIKNTYSESKTVKGLDENGDEVDIVITRNFLELVLACRTLHELQRLVNIGKKISDKKTKLLLDRGDRDNSRDNMMERILLSDTVSDLQNFINSINGKTNVMLPITHSSEISVHYSGIVKPYLEFLIQGARNVRMLDEALTLKNNKPSNLLINTESDDLAKINELVDSYVLSSLKKNIRSFHKVISSNKVNQKICNIFVPEDKDQSKKSSLIKEKIKGNISDSKTRKSAAMDKGLPSITKLPKYKLGAGDTSISINALSKGSNIGVSNYIRWAAEEIVNNQLLEDVNGDIRRDLLNSTLALLIYSRDKMEEKLKINKYRLPGESEDGYGKDKNWATAGKVISFINDFERDPINSLLSRLKNGVSGPVNRPMDGTNLSAIARNQFQINSIRSLNVKPLPGNLADSPNRYIYWQGNMALGTLNRPNDLLGREEYYDNDRSTNAINQLDYNKEVRFTHSILRAGKINYKNKYLVNRGMATTLSELTDWSLTTPPNTLEELNEILKSSPYITTPRKFSSINRSYGSQSLSVNTYWEVTLEPFVHNQMNGGFSYLPSFREMNSQNLINHGSNTGYNSWLPIIQFDLDKSRMLNKSLGLYDGEIVFPSGVEFTNELTLTLINDGLKAMGGFWKKVMEVSVYNSEPHKADFYREKYPVPTAIDRSCQCIALYKNVTWRCRIYILSPQYTTIKKFDLLVVLKEFNESYSGDIDSPGGDITLKFSIVGENPPPETPFEIEPEKKTPVKVPFPAPAPPPTTEVEVTTTTAEKGEEPRDETPWPWPPTDREETPFDKPGDPGYNSAPAPSSGDWDSMKYKPANNTQAPYAIDYNPTSTSSNPFNIKNPFDFSSNNWSTSNSGTNNNKSTAPPTNNTGVITTTRGAAAKERRAAMMNSRM